MRPLLLRPPDECCPSVNAFTGAPLYSDERSMLTSWRWLGVVGLYVFNAIGASLQSRGHVDPMTLFQGHDRALHIGLLPDLVLEHLELALAGERVDVLDLDVEQLLDCFLDLRLGRVPAHFEH